MTPKTQDAPCETGQDLNDPQPQIYDAPGQTVAYAIYHPDHGFAETCHSAIEDLTESRNEGMAILLYRERDVAAADRLQRNWSDKATIIPVRIPELNGHVETDPAQLYAIRRKSDGEFHANDINNEPKIMQVHCFASFDEAAAARLLFSKPEDEIVPLVVARANGETSHRSETSDADEPDAEDNTGTPSDVEDFIGAVANETQWLIELVQGLHEVDNTRETIERIKDHNPIRDEGAQGSALNLLDRPLRDILHDERVYLPDDDARSCVLYLGNVIEARLKILHEFASAVQERNIIGTPEGLTDWNKRLRR